MREAETSYHTTVLLNHTVCGAYLQSSISLRDALAEFLELRVSLLLWIIQQVTVVLQEESVSTYLRESVCV